MIFTMKFYDYTGIKYLYTKSINFFNQYSTYQKYNIFNLLYFKTTFKCDFLIMKF